MIQIEGTARQVAASDDVDLFKKKIVIGGTLISGAIGLFLAATTGIGTPEMKALVAIGGTLMMVFGIPCTIIGSIDYAKSR